MIELRPFNVAQSLVTSTLPRAPPIGPLVLRNGRAYERIPVERRGAWLRHQTTVHDDMSIPRVKGARHAIRRELARISRALLDLHRRDAAHAERLCPLCAQRTAPELP